jgi:hypothetical protein
MPYTEPSKLAKEARAKMEARKLLFGKKEKVKEPMPEKVAVTNPEEVKEPVKE